MSVRCCSSAVWVFLSGIKKCMLSNQDPVIFPSVSTINPAIPHPSDPWEPACSYPPGCNIGAQYWCGSAQDATTTLQLHSTTSQHPCCTAGACRAGHSSSLRTRRSKSDILTCGALPAILPNTSICMAFRPEGWLTDWKHIASWSVWEKWT